MSSTHPAATTGMQPRVNRVRVQRPRLESQEGTQGQLSTHLKRLPPQRSGLIIPPQKGGRSAQRRCNAIRNCITTRPKQGSVKERNSVAAGWGRGSDGGSEWNYRDSGHGRATRPATQAQRRSRCSMCYRTPRCCNPC
eukprot:4687933-Prymnesium_polylepis.1